MKKKFKENDEYHKLFDTGNKGFLTQQEKIIYNIFRAEYKFCKEDILDMEINEENINKLVCKFNLKFNKNTVKEMVEFINVHNREG
ncbi:hypothetical protein AAJ76_1200011476 [Vairimorpha ceranae]|uniref:Uncharacterized protein n=1 Tax=Vairimorpha ceranae TaxID=40302 RepID=A0A0F9ZE03_9MICR|nr:hypothetical protein AAJ76_1200011476 [Vairimorpha ceranae]KAF5140931.1 hypothetical protein G9O61_00g009210 [Vairimorpha ceranae]KKO75769.1 hypothetical protein AAJ76_1200011476 [Vairimorpha ceranae]